VPNFVVSFEISGTFVFKPILLEGRSRKRRVVLVGANHAEYENSDLAELEEALVTSLPKPV